jgi:hypothetical protein
MLHTPRRKRKPGEARSHLGVILGPSPNTYGAIEAWNLATEKVVTRFHFDVLAEIPEGFPWEIQKLPTPLGGTFKQLTTVVPIKRKRKRNSKSKLSSSFDPKLLTPRFVMNNDATEPAINSINSVIVDDTQEGVEAIDAEITEATIDEPLPAEPTREGELLETFDMDELDHIPLGESNEYNSQDELIHQSELSSVVITAIIINHTKTSKIGQNKIETRYSSSHCVEQNDVYSAVGKMVTESYLCYLLLHTGYPLNKPLSESMHRSQ